MKMEFQRILIALLLLLFSTFIHALSENTTNQGVAFIHGTSDHRSDAYGGYWKTGFIQSVAQGLVKPENYYVVHCDFRQYMWHDDAANCVVDQLLEFINEKNISTLTIYTHSNGANVMRWIVSNPTYDKRYMTLKKKTRQIIALAPSSSGTVLADEALSGGVFESSVAWLLGYLFDAVKQQRIGDMLIYNEELLLGSIGRPSLSVPFKVIVGTDVFVSPFSMFSYCNGYLLNSGLKIAQLYLESCSDGFLNCSSQASAGSVWFKDTERTENNQPLNHNQSRHSCFGLDQILISAFASEGVPS